MVFWGTDGWKFGFACLTGVDSVFSDLEGHGGPGGNDHGCYDSEDGVCVAISPAALL